jgi:GT2 family glycosyltransferase
MRPRFGCVVLTRGDRADALRLGLESLRRQRDVDVDVVVVGNGCELAGLLEGVRSVTFTENVGATAGRNAGVARVGGDLLLFLDDDARLAEDDALARIARRFEADPRLALIQPRVADPAGAPAPRHWVPRLRVGDAGRSSEVTSVWEGAVAVRREAFAAVGGWPEDFFYLHEGIDLTWRLLDAGWRAWYAGDVLALHPALPAARHGPVSRYLNGRNRAWLARRHLPWPLGGIYVAGWLFRSLARVRSRREARTLLRGFADGLRRPASARRPLRARTLWKMTRAGRPPVV